MKNILVLVAILLASCSISTANVILDGLGYEVSQDTNTAKVSGTSTVEFKANVETIEIASEVEYLGVKYPVTTVGKGMFWSFNKLRKVVLPNSITELEQMTFIQCPLLEELQLPYGIMEIPNFSFTGLKSVISFPRTVSRFGAYSCIKLAFAPEYDFRDAVSIGSRSFVSCPINELYFSDGIEIGSEAFHSCNKLRYIELPNEFTIYGNGAFQGCGALERVVVKSVVPRKLIDAGTGNEIDGLVINSELSQNCTLYVPKGSGQAYRNSDSWRNFKNIVEIDFAGLNSVETTEEEGYQVWNLSGVYVSYGLSLNEALNGIAPGVYIIRHNGKVEKKVVL